MRTFAAADGTLLAYRSVGDGAPLVCIPGGPGRASDYLGELGGLARRRRLVLVDPRGVGGSQQPADLSTLRVDRLIDDLEGLREHLGLERMELLAHSAGCVLATLYAAAYPQRIARLALITPGLAALGISADASDIAARIARHAAEPWYRDASAAWQQLAEGDISLAAFRRSRPLFYGRWDDAARAHTMLGVDEKHFPARQGYFDGVDLDPAGPRARLAELGAPVLLYGGEFDPLVSAAMLHDAASLLPDATVVVQAGAGHFPWVDDPGEFAAAVAGWATGTYSHSS